MNFSGVKLPVTLLPSEAVPTSFEVILPLTFLATVPRVAVSLPPLTAVAADEKPPSAVMMARTRPAASTANGVLDFLSAEKHVCVPLLIDPSSSGGDVRGQGVATHPYDGLSAAG